MENREDNNFHFLLMKPTKDKKNDPLKLIFESIEWSFISPLVKDYYPDNKDLIYSPLSLKLSLFVFSEVESNRQLAKLCDTIQNIVCYVDFIVLPELPRLYLFCL